MFNQALLDLEYYSYIVGIADKNGWDLYGRSMGGLGTTDRDDAAVPWPMPTLSPAPSPMLSPVLTTSDNSNHTPSHPDRRATWQCPITTIRETARREFS
jgi:hypothetical protein